MMSEVNLNKDEDINVLAGFQEVFDHISTKGPGDTTDDDVGDDQDDDQGTDDSDDDQNDDNDNDQNDDNQDNDDDDDSDDSDDSDDDNDDDDDSDVNNDNDSDDNDSDDSNDDSNDDSDNDSEEEMITPFVDLFSQELGWDIDDKDKPKDIKGLISFMQDLVAESSKPKYFSEEVQQLDEFVKNGGNLREFYTAAKSGISLENIDLSKEANQKAAVAEHMKILNYSDEKITKKIERFDESGILEEEAQESVEFLEGYREQKAEKLLKDQQKASADRVKEQQKFISTVETTIKETNSILGVSLNTAQQKELIDYILKVDAKGRTKNQIDYSKDPIQRLIETAFVQKEGQNFQSKLNTKAKNDAVKDFKNKLKNTKKNKRGKQQQGYQSKGGSFDMISSITKQLL